MKERKQKNGGAARIVAWVLLFALFIAIGYAAKMFLGGSLTGHDTVIDVNTLKSQVKTINELSTRQVDYREVVEYEGDAAIFNKKFILTFDGIIRAGVDMDEVDFTMNNEGEFPEITVVMPAAQILSHEDSNIQTVHEEGFYQEDLGRLRNDLITDAKAGREAGAIEDGLLDDAYDAAKETISGFIRIAYGDQVVVRFEKA